VKLMETLKRALAPVKSDPPEPPPGLHNFRIPGTERDIRFQLRVDPDGSGVLLVDASSVVTLNPTAASIVKRLLDGRTPEWIRADLKRVMRRFDAHRFDQDVERMHELLRDLREGRIGEPVMNLADLPEGAYARSLAAPYRADMSLQLSGAPPHPLPGAEPVDVRRAHKVLERLAEVGVPLVQLRVGPRTDGELVVNMVERAEDLGLVCGLRLSPAGLNDAALGDRLTQAGLDLLQVPYHSVDPALHDALAGNGSHAASTSALERIAQANCYTQVLLVLAGCNKSDSDRTLTRLAELGAESLVVTALVADPHNPHPEGLARDALPALLVALRAAAERHGLRWTWAPPLELCPDCPLPDQTACAPRAEGELAIYVEPDGTVIPARGPFRPAGNLLTDAWETIWADPRFAVVREIQPEPDRCELCPELEICVGGCPRLAETGSRRCGPVTS
jgi:radical SAM protein with 4Fe4S-binding SPASM domain